MAARLEAAVSTREAEEQLREVDGPVCFSTPHELSTSSNICPLVVTSALALQVDGGIVWIFDRHRKNVIERVRFSGTLRLPYYLDEPRQVLVG